MQDNVSVLIATIVAVIIIVLFPIYNIATRQDSIANNMVVEATTNFVDEVRNKGYIEKERYGQYLNELDKTGNRYEVELEVYKPILLKTDSAETEYEEDYEIFYTDEIMAEMSDPTKYIDEGSVKKTDVMYLTSDYKFYVRVKNTNITQAQILFDRLLSGTYSERIVVNYGGVVFTNEWEQGENAEITSANISISNPLDHNMQEYKFEHIVDVPDPFTSEITSIYGIAVRLSDMVAGADRINFILKYKGVEKMTPANDKASLEPHVISFLETTGIDADIAVTLVDGYPQAVNGRYNYEFIVTLTNISYDFLNLLFKEGTLKVNAGSAYVPSGAVNEVSSKEFVVFYETVQPEIELSANPDVIANSAITPANSNITFTFSDKTTSPAVIIEKYVYEIYNNGVLVDSGEINADSNEKASISYEFEEGTGSIKVHGVSTRGNNSEAIGAGFVIANNYLLQSIPREGVGLTIMETVAIPGAIIESFEFTTFLPYHGGTDYWRIEGFDTTTGTWINLLSDDCKIQRYTLNDEDDIDDGYYKDNDFETYYEKIKNHDTTNTYNFRSDGNGFTTKWIEVEKFNEFRDEAEKIGKCSQLRFIYRTTQRHDGTDCLRDGNISYRVKYKFDG